MTNPFRKLTHEEKIRERMRGFTRQAPPNPWRVVSHAVGGLTEIGYDRGTDLLLAVSESGRGLFDCRIGQRIARNSTAAAEGSWYQPIKLLAEGIDVIAKHTISLAGLHGGGLPLFAEDGWSLQPVAPDWPRAKIILCPSFRSALSEQHGGGCVCVGEDYEFRAYGFSETGLSFVIATSSTLKIFTRSEG